MGNIFVLCVGARKRAIENKPPSPAVMAVISPILSFIHPSIQPPFVSQQPYQAHNEGEEINIARGLQGGVICLLSRFPETGQGWSNLGAGKGRICGHVLFFYNNSFRDHHLKCFPSSLAGNREYRALPPCF